MQSITKLRDMNEQPTPLPIGQRLLRQGWITEQDLERGLALQKEMGGRIGAILVRMGAVSEEHLLQALSEQLELELLDPETGPPAPGAVHQALEHAGLSPDWLLDQQLLLWEDLEGTIHCASPDPLDSFCQEVVHSLFRSQNVRWHLASAQQVESALHALTETEEKTAQGEGIQHLREMAEEAPAIEQVNNIIARAVSEGASDIHLEPEKDGFYVRYRIDGLLHTHSRLSQELFLAVASRIKLLSGMDIAERRLPQDGRIRTRASGVEMDIRVSALPSVKGESLVLRLLASERSDLQLENLGMEPDLLDQLQKWGRAPHGIVLVTGPTGSGKSTTLYALLRTVDDRQRKIITVEDPVEYEMPGITQIQVHEEIGYTFAHALRAILRQDPDVVMIGEVRDSDTANIATQAALTGHLVLSTLHTNTAAGAFNRMIDMGIEPFLLASAVLGVVAQRLVRRLCPHCAREAPPPSWVKELLAETTLSEIRHQAPSWKVPGGCSHCHETGYRGRIGIYEYLPVDSDLQAAIVNRVSTAELEKLRREKGFRSLREDGIIKVWNGLTSLEEVLRVTAGEAT